jgi:predicted nucleic acid-binding protein
MTAKSFVNTKVVLYTIGKNARKADIAREFVGAQPSISTQVVNESISGVSDGQSRRWINMPCGSQIQTPP